jgi:predicted choloylglycine hydrolase
MHPPLADEFLAYADAQRLDPKTLWQKCCRVNLKAHIRATVHEEQGEGCSTVAWYPAQDSYRANLGLSCVPPVAIVGRNYDYWPMQTRRQRIRFVPNAHAYASIGARGGVPCGRYDGMNAHGLFASLHVVMTDNPGEDEVKPGLPFHLIVRMALELCRTAREAADLLLHLPHLSSLNYLLADKHEAFVIEADPRRVRLLERDGNVLAATNHYRHPDMKPFQGRRVNTNSECRLSFLMSPLRPVAPSIKELLANAERAMADRTAPMCGTSGALTTLWSCVAELGSQHICYAPGPPGVVAYEEVESFSD